MKDYLPFREYIDSMGLVALFDDDTGEYEVRTISIVEILHGSSKWVIKPGELIVSIPAHMARHNLPEAKQLIQVGLDLQNCFAC